MVAVAMGVALAVLLTSFVTIPLPSGAGFLNFTDVFIVFYSLFFGPWIGAAVGALSGLMVDIILGYAFYAPFTVVIKFVEGLVVGFLFLAIKNKLRYLAPFIGGAVMALLYFIPDYIALQNFYACLVNLGLNLVQGMVGATLGLIIYLVIKKTKLQPPI